MLVLFTGNLFEYFIGISIFLGFLIFIGYLFFNRNFEIPLNDNISKEISATPRVSIDQGEFTLFGDYLVYNKKRFDIPKYVKSIVISEGRIYFDGVIHIETINI